jgi:hypothetical protein
MYEVFQEMDKCWALNFKLDFASRIDELLLKTDGLLHKFRHLRVAEGKL